MLQTRASLTTADVEAVLGRGSQLCGGQLVAAVQIDHGAGQRRMAADHVGHLGGIDVDVQVAIQHDLTELGDQTGVVLAGEERRVDAEHLGDAQQYRHRERPDVVLDLVQVTGRYLEHLSQRGLAESPFAPELPDARADERFGHVNQPNNPAKKKFASLAIGGVWQYRRP